MKVHLNWPVLPEAPGVISSRAVPFEPWTAAVWPRSSRQVQVEVPGGHSRAIWEAPGRVPAIRVMEYSGIGGSKGWGWVGSEVDLEQPRTEIRRASRTKSRNTMLAEFIPGEGTKIWALGIRPARRLHVPGLHKFFCSSLFWWMPTTQGDACGLIVHAI